MKTVLAVLITLFSTLYFSTTAQAEARHAAFSHMFQVGSNYYYLNYYQPYDIMLVGRYELASNNYYFAYIGGNNFFLRFSRHNGTNYTGSDKVGTCASASFLLTSMILEDEGKVPANIEQDIYWASGKRGAVCDTNSPNFPTSGEPL